MKLHILLIFASLITLLSLDAKAEGVEKKFNVGIGTYALKVAYDGPYLLDDDLSGIGISVSYAFSDQFALRGEYYTLDHDDISALDDTGIDLVIYFGTGLATHGFKAYIGGGIFNETWELLGYEEDFSGLQINGGIGYNWDPVALDFVLGIRDSSDYEDFIQRALFINVDAAAISGSLILSARF
jgi:hypothetical protein